MQLSRLVRPRHATVLGSAYRGLHVEMINFNGRRTAKVSRSNRLLQLRPKTGDLDTSTGVCDPRRRKMEVYIRYSQYPVVPAIINRRVLGIRSIDCILSFSVLVMECCPLGYTKLNEPVVRVSSNDNRTTSGANVIDHRKYILSESEGCRVPERQAGPGR